MSKLLVAVFCLRALVPVLAEPITIYAVSATTTIGPVQSLPPPDIKISPLGVGSDGATTYDAIFQYASGGSPLAFPSRSFHGTYIADATQILFSAQVPAIGVNPTTTITESTPITEIQRCSWGTERNQGTCVLELDGDAIATYTGPVLPMYTLEGSQQDGGGGSLNNPSPTGASGNGAISSVYVQHGPSTAMLASLLGVGVVAGVARLFAL